jgi:hypothetical protein
MDVRLRRFIRRLLRRPDEITRVTWTTGDPDEWPLPSDSEPLPPGALMHPNSLQEHAQRTMELQELRRRAREKQIDG